MLIATRRDRESDIELRECQTDSCTREIVTFGERREWKLVSGLMSELRQSI